MKLRCACLARVRHVPYQCMGHGSCKARVKTAEDTRCAANILTLRAVRVAATFSSSLNQHRIPRFLDELTAMMSATRATVSVRASGNARQVTAKAQGKHMTQPTSFLLLRSSARYCHGHSVNDGLAVQLVPPVL